MSEPKRESIWNNLNNTKLIRYVLLFVLAWAIVQVLAHFSSIIITFIFAAIFAFLLNFPVRWFARFMPRSLAVMLVFSLGLLILVGIIATLGTAVFAQIQLLVAQAPQLLDSAIESIDRLRGLLSRWNINIDFSQFQNQLRTQVLTTLGLGFATFQNVLLNLIDLIIIAVISLFMLFDGKRLWDLLLKIFPMRMRDRVTKVVQKSFLGFFWRRFILSVFYGVAIYLVFWWLGVPSALGLAAIVSTFGLIPGIGAAVGAIFASLVILPQGIGTVLISLVSCIVLQQVQDNLLMPRIMQGSIDLNPVVMFFALLVGAQVAGLVGVFLSIPIASILISLCEIRELQGNGN